VFVFVNSGEDMSVEFLADRGDTYKRVMKEKNISFMPHHTEWEK